MRWRPSGSPNWPLSANAPAEPRRQRMAFPAFVSYETRDARSSDTSMVTQTPLTNYTCGDGRHGVSQNMSQNTNLVRSKM